MSGVVSRVAIRDHGCQRQRRHENAPGRQSHFGVRNVAALCADCAPILCPWSRNRKLLPRSGFVLRGEDEVHASALAGMQLGNLLVGRLFHSFRSNPLRIPVVHLRRVLNHDQLVRPAIKANFFAAALRRR